MKKWSKLKDFSELADILPALNDEFIANFGRGTRTTEINLWADGDFQINIYRTYNDGGKNHLIFQRCQSGNRKRLLKRK